MKRRHLVALGLLAVLAPAAAPGTAGASTGSTATACLARQLPYIDGVFEPSYTPGCTGHDEPEIDPISNLPHSAKNMTWKAVLPVNGVFPVGATGPTFWFGGTVNVRHSLFHQGFLELQLYPDSVVTKCSPNGGASIRHRVGVYTACSPVWSIVGQAEPAAFNAMLRRGQSDDPLIMHAGDTITVHYFETTAHDGAHITVRDLNTHRQGTIVLRTRKNGPLNPTFDVQRVGNSLGWGIVHDTPNSFVWEIGHTSIETGAQFCIPGDTICQSYNRPAWAGTQPIRIISVRFGDRGTARHWAVVSDFGGKAEVLDPQESKCSAYGGPFCIYPWYTRNGDGSFSFGVNYPTTVDDYGQANQYPQQTHCGGPFGKNTTYCVNRIA